MKLLWICVVLSVTGNAQLFEDFSDGDYSSNPAWTVSDPADWIVNSALQLRSNNTMASASFYASTPCTAAYATQWEFYIQLSFNTSSVNYADVYLMASGSDLTQSGITGYFVRIGNTQDEISLYRRNGDGTAVRIIDGGDGKTASQDNKIRIRVVRTGTYVFTLYSDITGTGNSYQAEGSVMDSSFITSGWFGILVRQSTSGFFQKHYFDDILVQPFLPDTLAPAIEELQVSGPGTLKIRFNEAVDPISAADPLNYILPATGIHPASITMDPANGSGLTVMFTQEFNSGIPAELLVGNIADLYGNIMQDTAVTFLYYRPVFTDVVIHEIMADPSPPVGLPNAEYIEIRNRTMHAINIAGWKIATASATGSAFSSYSIPPGGLLILTAASQAALFAPYGDVLGISLPPLPNDGGVVSLVSQEGRIIHAVEYAASWISNPVKKEGGWSLEMVDASYPFSNNNWKVSQSASGGTPGQPNSVEGSNPDKSAPRLLRSHTSGPHHCYLIFSEPLDSASSIHPSNYNLSDGLMASSVMVMPPLFQTVLVNLQQPMEPGKIYTAGAAGIRDCSGNMTADAGTVPFGLAAEAVAGDVVINEILFNPFPGDQDFLEVYNRSNKIIDLSALFIANRNAAGIISNVIKASAKPFFLFPGDYALFTSDPDMLRLRYFVKFPQYIIPISSLPSFPDDKGTAILLNSNGDVVDELAYSYKWHYPLLANPEGVSLERINPASATQDPLNWHSAASTAGYATPGYRNSQYLADTEIAAMATINPRVFSPDLDGHDDFTTITLTLPEPGYMASLRIFDSQGRFVRTLAQNALAGLKSQWTWNGLDDHQRRNLPGIYILFIEVFNLQGKKKIIRETIIIAAGRPVK